MAVVPAAADEVVYGDELAPGWQDCSWDASIDFASSALVYEGDAAIQVQTTAWGALSLCRSAPFDAAAMLRFWIEGEAPQLWVTLEAPDEGVLSDPISPPELELVTGGSFSEIRVDLTALGSHDWSRITWQDASGFGTSVRLDRIELLDELPVPDEFTGAMPVAPDRILLLGGGDVAGATVTSAGQSVDVVGSETATEPHRVYLELAEPVAAGELVLQVGGVTFERTVAAEGIDLETEPTHEISPWIYGVALAPSSDFVQEHGVTVARWGGNTSSLYNPLGHYANTGNDWYFENYVMGSAEQWLGWMQHGGARTFLSVPALDWVARDDSSYSYSVALYGDQEEVDPFQPDAGNGIRPNGTPITWNDPTDAATPWSPTQAGDWLASLSTVPDIAAVDNELDIASSTHQDVHPDPMTYDELLERYLDTARVIREELPGTEIAGLSSCCWWYYWNSAAGDKPQHGGQDFLPWFLEQMEAEEAASGERLLDVLDVHYYPDAEVFNDRMDPDTAARRLRTTRSLWDPGYTDEGWIGEDHDATQDQPSPNQVQLIPRMKALIDDHYPGTELGITEWNFGADAHLSGGLATADALGIFGREGLYLANFWSCPQAGTPAAAAFRLYRDPGGPFGHRSLPAAFDDPDRLGVYAALDDGDELTLVVVNKDPDVDLLLEVGGLAEGTYESRQFGGPLGGTLVVHPEMSTGGALLVPAYSALFLATGEMDPSGDDDDTSGDDDDTTAGDDDDDDDSAGPGGRDCDCRLGGGGFAGGELVLVLAAAGLLVRRRSRDTR